MNTNATQMIVGQMKGHMSKADLNGLKALVRRHGLADVVTKLVEMFDEAVDRDRRALRRGRRSELALPCELVDAVGEHLTYLEEACMAVCNPDDTDVIDAVLEDELAREEAAATALMVAQLNAETK